jgi:integrase
MAVEDAWIDRAGNPTKRHGRGLRYRVRWYELGKPRSMSFRTKAEADRHWFRVNTMPTVKPTRDVTVGELSARWVATKAGMRPKTQEAARTASAHVVAQFGLEPAGSVLPSDVRVWNAGMAGSASLRRQALLALSAMMRMAVEDGLIPANPCASIKPPKAARRDPIFMSPAELLRLAQLAGPDEPIVLVLGTTGLRVGEVLNLKVGDFDPKRRRLRVRSSKNHQARDVPVAPFVVAHIDVAGRKAGDWLFPTPSGTRWDVTNWRRTRFRKAAEAFGRPEVTPHYLRHTAASLSIASGADVKMVQRMMGHKSGAMTIDLYGHLWDEGLDDVARRMDAALGV